MKKLLLPLFLIVFLASCSVFQETTSYEEVDNADADNSEEVYVFDEVNEDGAKTNEIKDLNNEIDNTLNDENKETTNKTNYEVESTVVETVTEPAVTTEKEKVETVTTYEQPVNTVQFYVQLGAFSTIKRAERFASQIDPEVPFGLSIIFDGSKEYFIVRSSPYATRTEAEGIRDELKHKTKFKDCFIVTE